MENETRIAEEHTFATFDGTELFYRHWRGEGKKAIVLFHRGHEHGGRLQDVVDTLGLPDSATLPFGCGENFRGRMPKPGGPSDGDLFLQQAVGVARATLLQMPYYEQLGCGHFS
jgi:hypothetical protein